MVDLFERRRIDIRCLQDIRYSAKEPDYIMEKRKITSFGGADQ